MSNMTELLEEIGRLRAENERLEADNRSKNGSMKAFGEQIAKLQRAVKNRDKMLANQKALTDQANYHKAQRGQIVDELRAEVEVLKTNADLYRQWFEAVLDTNAAYLEHADYVAAVALYKSLGMRVPSSLTQCAKLASV